jgi:hypothetical protein
VNDIIERIKSVSNEMETKTLLAEAGLKTTDIHLTGYVNRAKAKRGSHSVAPEGL